MTYEPTRCSHLIDENHRYKSMKSFQQYITEVFDKPFPHKLVRGGYGSGQTIYTFETDSEDYQEIKVILDFFGGRLDVSFTSNGSLNLTGKGNAGRILATVLEILLKFIKEANPSDVKFIAATDSPARERVYKKMVDRYLKGSGYMLDKTKRVETRPTDDDEVHFYIERI